MLKKISNLGIVLNKLELQSIHGGDLVICSFSDGGNWSGSSSDSSTVVGMLRHCRNQGGTPFWSQNPH